MMHSDSEVKRKYNQRSISKIALIQPTVAQKPAECAKKSATPRPLPIEQAKITQKRWGTRRRDKNAEKRRGEKSILSDRRKKDGNLLFSYFPEAQYRQHLSRPPSATYPYRRDPWRARVN
ncbi:hypothetical protein AVEN_248153-1 [Araneus ventricosus]|uniref:Uncharacterized protein n=1 Tax=Araneus ventricosus TaxID=182803 RepID=A0A4Y2WMJ5_ARAVE|nr:hypothetical protein AVEN_248153-1 [Araneus ventricosus]